MASAVADQATTARFPPLWRIAGPGARVFALAFAVALSFCLALLTTAAASRLCLNLIVTSSFAAVWLVSRLPVAVPIAGSGGSIATLTQQRAGEERADDGPRGLAART
jgi:hypothetical protein